MSETRRTRRVARAVRDGDHPDAIEFAAVDEFVEALDGRGLQFAPRRGRGRLHQREMMQHPFVAGVPHAHGVADGPDHRQGIEAADDHDVGFDRTGERAERFDARAPGCPSRSGTSPAGLSAATGERRPSRRARDRRRARARVEGTALRARDRSAGGSWPGRFRSRAPRVPASSGTARRRGPWCAANRATICSKAPAVVSSRSGYQGSGRPGSGRPDAYGKMSTRYRRILSRVA